MSTHFPKPGVPFTLREATARGITPEQLRNPKYERPFRGLRVLPDPETPKLRTQTERTLTLARAYVPLLKPGALFSHSTALLLYGCPIRAPLGLHVSVNFASHAPERAGVIGHRYRAPLTRMRVHGLPVVSPELAIVQAARSLPETEVVVAIDHLVREGQRGSTPIITPETLQRALAATSLKGVRNARRAYALSRVGAESRMETLLRLQLGDTGITGLELQVEIHDGEGFIGRFDLVDRERRVIYEYDGEQHRTDRAQYLTDLLRLDRVRAAGWSVLRFHFEDLFGGPAILKHRLRSAGLEF